MSIAEEFFGFFVLTAINCAVQCALGEMKTASLSCLVTTALGVDLLERLILKCIGQMQLRES